MPEIIKQTQLFRFDQMAVQVKDKVEPEEADVDRYVGLEHIDPESLKIRRWGEPSDVESSKILFRSGDIIFGKRRAYQRKLAVADFDGICSAHAMVLRPKTDVVLEEFLPFFMQSDIFMDRAVKISVGGLSPTINWRDLAKEEFALPPLEEQRRIAEVSQAAEQTKNSLMTLENSYEDLQNRLLFRDTSSNNRTVADFVEVVTKGTTPRHMGHDYKEQGIPFLRGEDLQNDTVNLDSASKRIDSETHDKLARSKLKTGDVLLSIAGTIGRVGLMMTNEIEANCNQAVSIIRPTSTADSEFLFYWLQSSYVQSFIRSRIITGTIPNLNLPMVRSIPVPDYSKAEKTDFVAASRQANALAKQIGCRIDSCRRVNQSFLQSLSEASS